MEYLYYHLKTPQKMTKKDSERKKNYSNKYPGYTGPVKPETLADRASASGELDYLTVKPTNKSFSPLNPGPKITLKGFVKDKKKGGTNKD